MNERVGIRESASLQGRETSVQDLQGSSHLSQQIKYIACLSSRQDLPTGKPETWGFSSQPQVLNDGLG